MLLRESALRRSLGICPFDARSYSGEAAERKQGNIITTRNIRETIASCIVGAQLSTVSEFTSPFNISRLASPSHPTEAPLPATLVVSTSHFGISVGAFGISVGSLWD